MMFDSEKRKSFKEGQQLNEYVWAREALKLFGWNASSASKAVGMPNASFRLIIKRHPNLLKEYQYYGPKRGRPRTR